MVLSKKVVVKPGGIHGFCWFAGEDIKAGEMIWAARAPGAAHTDVLLTWEQVQALTPEKRDKFMSLAYQVNGSHYLGLDPEREPIQSEIEELYVNHSCDGNCWYMNDDLLVSMRDIRAGEELCYDYALTEGHHEWILAEKCLCGTAACRGRVTGNDWKLATIQARYGEHFLPYILGLIKAYNAANGGAAAAATTTSASPAVVAEEAKSSVATAAAT